MRQERVVCVSLDRLKTCIHDPDSDVTQVMSGRRLREAFGRLSLGVDDVPRTRRQLAKMQIDLLNPAAESAWGVPEVDAAKHCGDGSARMVMNGSNNTAPSSVVLGAESAVQNSASESAGLSLTRSSASLSQGVALDGFGLSVVFRSNSTAIPANTRSRSSTRGNSTTEKVTSSMEI